MKSLFLFICVIFCSTQFLLGNLLEKDREHFVQANTFYHKKEYKKALELYQKIQKKWYAVWFNLGNCAYQLMQHRQAYAYWLQSEQGAPLCMQSKLEYHYRLLSDNHGIHSLRPLYRQCIMRLSLFYVQLFFILLWSFFCISLYLRCWKNRPIFFMVICLCTCISGILVFMCYSVSNQKYLVTKENIFLYAGPNKQYHTVGSCDAIGAVVIKDTYNSDWYKVDSHALTGWIFKDDSVSV